MMKRRKMLVILLLISLVAGTATESALCAQSFNNVSTVEAKSKLTKKKAKKALTRFLNKKIGNIWYISGSPITTKKKYIFWVKYTRTQFFGKFVVDRKTGKVKSYAPYIGYNDPGDIDVRLSKDMCFNVYNYL